MSTFYVETLLEILRGLKPWGGILFPFLFSLSSPPLPFFSLLAPASLTPTPPPPSPLFLFFLPGSYYNSPFLLFTPSQNLLSDHLLLAHGLPWCRDDGSPTGQVHYLRLHHHHDGAPPHSSQVSLHLQPQGPLQGLPGHAHGSISKHKGTQKLAINFRTRTTLVISFLVANTNNMITVKPRLKDTPQHHHDITDSSESPDCPSIHFTPE